MQGQNPKGPLQGPSSALESQGSSLLLTPFWPGVERRSWEVPKRTSDFPLLSTRAGHSHRRRSWRSADVPDPLPRPIAGPSFPSGPQKPAASHGPIRWVPEAGKDRGRARAEVWRVQPSLVGLGSSSLPFSLLLPCPKSSCWVRTLQSGGAPLRGWSLGRDPPPHPAAQRGGGWWWRWGAKRRPLGPAGQWQFGKVNGPRQECCLFSGGGGHESGPLARGA